MTATAFKIERIVRRSPMRGRDGLPLRAEAMFQTPEGYCCCAAQITADGVPKITARVGAMSLHQARMVAAALTMAADWAEAELRGFAEPIGVTSISASTPEPAPLPLVSP